MTTWIMYIIMGWFVGCIGGVGVLLYDYRGYGRDVKLLEFIGDVLLTFVLWPVVSHWIIWYTVRAIINLFGFNLSKIKNITIVKGK